MSDTLEDVIYEAEHFEALGIKVHARLMWKAAVELQSLQERVRDLEGEISGLRDMAHLGRKRDALGGTGFCPGACEYRELTSEISDLRARTPSVSPTVSDDPSTRRA